MKIVSGGPSDHKNQKITLWDRGYSFPQLANGLYITPAVRKFMLDMPSSGSFQNVGLEI